MVDQRPKTKSMCHTCYYSGVNMTLKLVLFIDGESTYESYPLPKNDMQWAEFYEQVTPPESVYRRIHAFSKSEDPCRPTPHFEHEYKILWEDEY
ncbi:hypothetical protein [Acinetobacter phage pB23]|nr:hypothetical protein [Acinetobacter phage pB23]